MIFRHAVIPIIGIVFLSSQYSWADCGQPYNLRHHRDAGRTDICDVDWPEHYEVLINWGTKPEWIDANHFAFVSNQVGDVYLMNLESRELRILTGHFKHAGFTRVHRLINGDLLLLGHMEGPRPPEDPLTHYNEGQFTGELFVLKKPYDGKPIPLGAHAWEGVAVSRESLRIAWSTSHVPFFGKNIVQTAGFYFAKQSTVQTGVIEYDGNGIPHLTNKEKLVNKWRIGPVHLEPQNFRGKDDEELLISAYGPFENLSGLLMVNRNTKKISRIKYRPMYQEWEGIHPDYGLAFVEIDRKLFLYFGFDCVELYLYHFEEKEFEQVGHFEAEYDKKVYVHEPVFSDDGKLVLFTTAAQDEAPDSPGYGIGIILFNYENFRRSNPR